MLHGGGGGETCRGVGVASTCRRRVTTRCLCGALVCRYRLIVKYKTAFYSFYLPVAAAMVQRCAVFRRVRQAVHVAGLDCRLWVGCLAVPAPLWLVTGCVLLRAVVCVRPPALPQRLHGRFELPGGP